MVTSSKPASGAAADAFPCAACLKSFGHPERIVWVADSFEGLPEPDLARTKERGFYHSRVMQEAYQKMAASEEEVRRNFAAYGLLDENVRFLKGWLKETLPSASIEQLAFIRLDGDFYESTLEPLNAPYHKLSSGGFVVVDDYGEDVWTDCRAAIDEFRMVHRISEPLLRVDSKCFLSEEGQGLSVTRPEPAVYVSQIGG